MDWKDWLAVVVFVLSSIALAATIYFTLGADDEPHCPTEDSCTIDYYDGEWHIEETTP